MATSEELTILESWTERSGKSLRSKALIRCFCGQEFVSWLGNIRRKNTKSCGCLRRSNSKKLVEHVHKHNVKHGHATVKTLTYSSWSAMIQRTTNKNHSKYKYYGAKGISVCETWRSFISFLQDMGERPGAEYSLDRIDPLGDYTPANCRWILQTENLRRMRYGD